jgi:5'-3' exonuclease
MGIKSLTKFLTEKYPEVFDNNVKLDEYAFKKIAVDTAIFMCKFKASNADAWLDSFASLIIWMRRSNVHPVFLLDDGMPPEKAAEKRKRAESRKKQEDRADSLSRAVDQYGECGGLEGLEEGSATLLRDTFDKEIKRNGPTSVGRKKALLLAPGAVTSEFDIHIVKEKLARMQKHMFTIKPEDYENLKKLLDVLQVPWVMAPGEAEKEGARMVRHHEAAAVLSEDSDCLAYKASTFLCKPDFYAKTVKRITFSSLLETIGMTGEEFVDFCIMCGTDYNPNIRGLGVSKSFDLIQKCKSIDNLPEKVDTSVLNHIVGRRLFHIDEKSEDTKTGLFTGTPVRSEVEKFLFKHNMRTSLDTLMSAMASNELVFE